MKQITHSLFKIQIPEAFKVRDQSDVGVWTEDRDAIYENQWPLISVVILRQSDLDSKIYEGDTWQERFEDSCLSIYFKSEKLSGENRSFKGFDAYMIKAHTDAPFQKTHFKINYLFAAIILDDDHYLEFRAVHEKTTDGNLEAWARDAMESLEIAGDTHTRLAAWRTHLIVLEEEERAYQEKLTSITNIEPEKKVYTTEIPADGKEIFQVGDFDFDILEEETHMQIGSFSGELVVTIQARTKQAKQAEKAEVLDDYPGNGLVRMVIPAKGIHHNGVPTGKLHFEEGKTNAPLFLHSRTEGFDYRLDFNGVAQFEGGWVLLKGEMTKSYHNKSFPITVYKKFDTDTLHWKDYRFTTMEETETASPEEVRFLYIENPTFQKLPRAIFTFNNLENLSISKRSNYLDTEKMPLTEISDEIGQLQKLTSFHLNGAAVEALPEALGTLKELEQLSINGCLLKTVPNSIWALPKLKYLWLSSNLLTTVPQTIKLPALQSISLDKNQLKTLPGALAAQPNLKKIDLEQNPLETLPEAFNKIEEIKLSIEDKSRLLNFDYEGADGTGLLTWDDAVFWAENDKELIPELDTVIASNKLEEHAAALKSMVKKSIGFKHTVEEDYTAIGNHRFGGMPDLPETISYPRFGENWRDDKEDYVYEFLGQINCGAIAHLQDYLPRTGVLFFFLETIHSIYGGTNRPGKVLYVKDTSKLLSGKRFEFTEDDYSEMIGGGYQGYQVSAQKMNSAPSFYASYVNTHLFLGAAEKLKDDEDLLEELYDRFETPINQQNLFEYAVNNYGFTQHESPELQASLGLKGNPQDWVVLLTVTSAGDMQWSDAGDLFFVIHKSDLAKQDFSNVYVTLESS